MISNYNNDVVCLPLIFVLAVTEKEPKSYLKLIYDYQITHITRKSAYEALEADIALLGLPNRYSSYESFRVNCHLKKNVTRHNAIIR